MSPGTVEGLAAAAMAFVVIPTTYVLLWAFVSWVNKRLGNG